MIRPTERLIGDLRTVGFEIVAVAASTEGVFPNGPSPWFERMGFEDQGALVLEEMHGAEIRLLQLRLRGRSKSVMSVDALRPERGYR